MNCLELERRLDEGDLQQLPAAALAHVGECARCARALARAQSLEQALARHFAASLPADSLPLAFTDSVMARVERGQARGVRVFALPDLMPWWTRVAAEPAVALACGLAALLLWKGDALEAGTRAWWAALPALPALHMSPGVLALSQSVVTWGQSLGHACLPGPQTPWTVATAMLIGTAPVFGLLGWLMWRLGERIALPPRGIAAR